MSNQEYPVEVVQMWANRCKDHLHTFCDDQFELVEEYISEAEHQDGLEYWLNFGTMPGLMEDFELYVSNRG